MHSVGVCLSTVYEDVEHSLQTPDKGCPGLRRSPRTRCTRWSTATAAATAVWTSGRRAPCRGCLSAARAARGRIPSRAAAASTPPQPTPSPSRLPEATPLQTLRSSGMPGGARAAAPSSHWTSQRRAACYGKGPPFRQRCGPAWQVHFVDNRHSCDSMLFVSLLPERGFTPTRHVLRRSHPLCHVNTSLASKLRSPLW